MIGTMIADDKGFVIETLDTLWDEPFMTVSRYRVQIMNGRPRSDREPVRFRSVGGGVWDGVGFECSTGNQVPESMNKLPMKRPRGMKVWRDGEWKKS